MPPHLPRTGPGTNSSEPFGSSLHEGGYAEGSATQPASQFGRRLVHVAPPPLTSKQQQLGNPQPWPLQQPAHTHTAAYHDEPGENFASPEDVAYAPAPGRRSRGSAIAYGTLGFLAGIVFWHAVGFWTLVHKAVFSGPRLEIRAEPGVPAAAAPPVAAFDEEKLRNSARRPTTDDTWQRPQNITTGSIGAPPAESIAATQPLTPPPDRIVDHIKNPPVATGPSGISWKPAVSRAP